jgi:hypothetical protein
MDTAWLTGKSPRARDTHDAVEQAVEEQDAVGSK